MTHYSFYEMFVDLLREMHASEEEILRRYPPLTRETSHQDLQEAFSVHFEQTKIHSERLKKIFSLLREKLDAVEAPAMQALFQEWETGVKKTNSPAMKDASSIIAAQKIEHYEMAGYGSAYAMACHLSEADQSGSGIYDTAAKLLESTLEDETVFDERLTEIAEGGFFTEGINDEAEKEKATL